MSIKLDKYTPLMMYLSPASIPQIVAHIQDYLVKHPILSVETIAEIIVQSLQEHPELINGEAIPISADSAQSIKAYIDALPALDTYTKAEINALLLGKQDTLTFDQAPTPGSSNPVTSSGIIAAMSALQSALETHISAKADRASTYTKTQVDTLLEDKADADDVYTKNTMDAKLLEINTDIDNIEDDVSHQSQQIDDLGPNNTLTSDSTTAALSAAQGKALKTLIDNAFSFSGKPEDMSIWQAIKNCTPGVHVRGFYTVPPDVPSSYNLGSWYYELVIFKYSAYNNITNYDNAILFYPNQMFYIHGSQEGIIFKEITLT